MMTKQQVDEAVAQGWYAPRTAYKAMDVDLAIAIADSVYAAQAQAAAEPDVEITWNDGDEVAFISMYLIIFIVFVFSVLVGNLAGDTQILKDCDTTGEARMLGGGTIKCEVKKELSK